MSGWEDARRWPFFALALATLVLLFFGLRSVLFEKVEESVARGVSGEAAINPYFALQELFRRFGAESRGVVGIRRLPPTGQTLVLAAPRRHFGSQGVERLLQWVEEGGHLVVIPEHPGGEDALMATLGVSWLDAHEVEGDEVENSSPFVSDRAPWPRLSVGEEAEVLFYDGAEEAAWILALRWGEGTATLVSDGMYLRNANLEQKDHPLIAWELLHGGRRALGSAAEPEEVWVVFRDPKPSIWAVLGARSRPLALSLLVLVVAFMVWISRRFGPLFEEKPQEQRHLAEHVRASGRYLWSVGAEDALLNSTRGALEQRLGHDLSAASLDGRLEDLAAAAHLETSALRKALALSSTRDRQRFAQTLQILETLRKSK